MERASANAGRSASAPRLRLADACRTDVNHRSNRDFRRLAVVDGGILADAHTGMVVRARPDRRCSAAPSDICCADALLAALLRCALFEQLVFHAERGFRRIHPIAREPFTSALSRAPGDECPNITPRIGLAVEYRRFHRGYAARVLPAFARPKHDVS